MPAPPTTRTTMAVHAAALVTGVAHHLDHVLRDDVGWPLSGEPNAFTYSLAVYPVVAVGLWLTGRGRPMRGYWVGVALVGIAFVLATHAGPAAPDPVGHVHASYTSPVAGGAAVAVLVGLFASLVTLLVVALRMPGRRAAAVGARPA